MVSEQHRTEEGEQGRQDLPDAGVEAEAPEANHRLPSNG